MGNFDGRESRVGKQCRIHPKPNEVKRKLGNPGKRALPDQGKLIALPMAAEPPTPPRPLGPEGLKLWNRIWEQGRTWISLNSDLEMVTLLCESMDERSQLRFLVFARHGRLARSRGTAKPRFTTSDYAQPSWNESN
jgi:hypothetical protein